MKRSDPEKNPKRYPEQKRGKEPLTEERRNYRSLFKKHSFSFTGGGPRGLRLREEGAPAERATAREAGEFLKSEKNSVLENDQNARLSPFPLSSLFLFSL